MKLRFELFRKWRWLRLAAGRDAAYTLNSRLMSDRDILPEVAGRPSWTILELLSRAWGWQFARRYVRFRVNLHSKNNRYDTP